MRLLKLGLALFFFALVLAIIFLWTPRAGTLDQDAIRKAAKTYETRIIRDNWGVAHIFGKTDPDTSFGLGYAQSEDDWDNLELSIMASRGMSAQYLGKDSAATDYLYDLFKVTESVSQKMSRELKPRTLAMAKAYADGINLWASQNPARISPGILPVTDTDIIAGFTWATPFFYRMDEDLTELFEDGKDPQVSPWRQDSHNLHLPEAVRGSNGFAIAPSRSADGHTRLIVNAHQPFNGQYAWYEAHVISEQGLNLAGAGFPGTPILTQGVTPHHGWTHTVNRPDLVDIYALKTDRKKKPKQYWIDGTWKGFEITKSDFRVKLFGPFSLPVKRDVLWSDHGPVLSTPTGHYAVRFSGLGEVKALEQWYEMSKAESLDEWKDAIAINGVLSFNIIYADKNGNIGTIYNAKMPKRIEGPDWQKILPGDQTDLIWQDYRPVSDLPQHYNPDSGWLFSANASPFHVTDPEHDNHRADYSKTFGIEKRMTNRALRARELMVPDASISEDELLEYRADTQYQDGVHIRKLIDELVADYISEPGELGQGAKILAQWNGDTDLENRSTALAVLTGMKATGYEYIENNMEPLEALKEAMQDLRNVYGRLDPIWGEVNRLRRGDVDLPLTGGPDTLRAIYGHQETFVENKGFAAVAGDSHIMYADWDADGHLELKSIHQFGAATLDESSPHYSDQSKLFAQGKYKTMPMTLEEVLPLATRDYRPGQ